MKVLLSIICLVIYSIAFSQGVKEEVEKRIDLSEMPQEAKIYIKQMPIETTTKIKYYFEKDRDRESYEAKFKFEDHKYSVEFDPDGNLQDIEVRHKKNDLPEDIVKRIEHYLQNTYSRYKIEKIQTQYLPLHAKRAFKEKIEPDGYELIVATKNEKNKLEKYEMTFNPRGSFLKSRKIVRRSYDFLLF
tara:strand:+ start:87 stop:650 length:564 start_codon:yes stop_codon:yes gene_type:complete